MKSKGKFALIAVFFLLTFQASAQNYKNEITAQGSGFYTKEATGLGVKSEPTNSGGFMLGYQYNINRWLAAQGTYDYFKNSQEWTAGTVNDRLQTSVHAFMANAVVKIPTDFMLKPFVLAGGGAMVFDPRNGSAIEKQTRGAFVYGGGVDLQLSRHFAARAQYRGFIYKAADFDQVAWKTDKYTHSAVPSFGLVFKF